MIAVREVGGHTFLEEDPEGFPEIVEHFGLFLGLFLECLEEALSDDLVELLDQRAVLHRLAGDVERQVGAIDDAT